MNNDYKGFDNGENKNPEDPYYQEKEVNMGDAVSGDADLKKDANTVSSEGADRDEVPSVGLVHEKKDEPFTGAGGEYHYNRSQMGDRGREQFARQADQTNRERDPYAQREGGSYTYHGPHGNSNQGNQGNYNQGSFRNTNPYASQNQNGGWNQYPPYGDEFTPFDEKKKPRKNGVGVGVLAIVCSLCVVLSAAAGFGGALLYNRGNDLRNSQSVDENTNNGGGTTVIDRVVESDGTTSTGEKGIYTEVAAKVMNTVVEITTEFQVTGFFQYVSEGAGSGVIISEDGYVITNNHVISDTSTGDVADTITVRLTNGNEYKASVVGKDADSDIAIIKITPDENLDYAVFGDSDKLIVGEEVLAVGNPLGELGGTVTNGIISALDREISVDGTTMNLLQTNAAINPGNSGGGLFNMSGELIGVVNAKSSGSGIEGLGFAIPSNDAHKVSQELIENGYVTGKVYLGISFVDVDDPYTAYRYFKSQSTGVYVMALEEGYNDEVLKNGDRIVAVDGNEITTFSQIKDILKDHSVGDTLEFTLYRSGKLIEEEVTCYEYVPDKSGSVDFEDQ